MSKFNMSSTLKAIFAGERATGRLQAALFDDSTSMTPNELSVSDLVNTLNEEHKGNADKCAAINMKVNRMSHAQAKDLELKKGSYKALAIKLDDEGVFYAEMVATRATAANPFMDAAKAFNKTHSQADLDKLMKIAIEQVELQIKAA